MAEMDEFTSLLTETDARLLVDLLKLAVANRIEDDQAKEIISSVLIGKYPAFGSMTFSTSRKFLHFFCHTLQGLRIALKNWKLEPHLLEV